MQQLVFLCNCFICGYIDWLNMLRLSPAKLSYILCIASKYNFLYFIYNGTNGNAPILAWLDVTPTASS